MPLSSQKAGLLGRFEEAARAGGWNVLFLSKNEHPARYRLVRGTDTMLVRVFIWQISHGGRANLPSEYRIQNTGVPELQSEPGYRNIILGWWPAIDVFAGWDIRQHLGPVANSPSMQINEEPLRKALISGFAPYKNQMGETAIAIRPDFMATYIEFLEALHDSGRIPKEAAVLDKLSTDPDAVPDEEIEDTVPGMRKVAIVTTKKKLRALDFGRRVLGAYNHQCAMCGTQLRLIDGAHILPVEHDESTDQTSNGIALCPLHHRAYDRGLVAFDHLFNVTTNETMVKKLKADSRDGGLATFRKNLRPVLVIPPDKKDRPARKMVEKANALRGWK
ncbi:MAG: HNH endonuclease [Bosea sp. (in: a-proteobacteria)]